jgi:hypothetical protein
MLALVGLIGVSFALRLLGALGRPTVVMTPDEYIYSELSRSLAFNHEPLIRGALMHYPSLGFPLLASPLWAFGDPMVVYRLTQALNALIASLAAIPVYLLARELGLRQAARLGVAALALALPGLALASYVSTDVLGYTVSLCALLAAVRALDQPTPRRLALFLAWAALACFARIQYAVLIPVFFAAWALLDPRRVYGLLRRHLVVISTIVVALVAVFVVVGLRDLLGGYRGVADFRVQPLDIARWISRDLLVLAFAVGAAVVPGAAVGLAASLARPRQRLERAFSLLVVLFFAALLVEAALFASNLTDEVEERYLFAILPALGVAFALAVERGRHLALAVSGVATVLLVVFLRFPLTAYDRPDHVTGSPFLAGVLWLQIRLGSGDAALLLTTVAIGLLLLGTLAFFLPRFLLPIALAGAIAFAVSFSAIATVQTNEQSRAAARTFLPKDFDRIDDLTSEPVGLVVTLGTPRPLATELMFWNHSIGDPIKLPGSDRVDRFRHRKGTIAADGRLFVEGKPWRGPLLISDYASRAQLRDARRLLHGLTSDLWQPRAEARFALLSKALYFDGWLAPGGSTTVWPDASGRLRGTLEIHLAPPPGIKSERISITTPWGSYGVILTAGLSRKTSIRLRGNLPAIIVLRSNHIGGLGDGRYVIAKARFRLVKGVHINTNAARAANR